MTFPESRRDDAGQEQVRPVSRLPVSYDGAPVPVTVQARAGLAHAKARFAADWKARTEKHGGAVNGMINYDPPSVAAQMEYARKAPWVPPGHEGGLFERAGRRYQKRYGIRGVALGNSFSAVHSRGISAFIAWLIVTGLIVALLCTAVFHGHHVPLIVGGALGTWALLLLSLFVPSREERRRSS